MNEMYATICTLCHSKEIKIAKMCNDTGISKSTLTELKSGRTRFISAKNIEKIARYFDVPVDIIYGKGVFRNWNDIIKYLDEVFMVLHETIPEDMYWRDEDEKFLFAYLQTSAIYSEDYTVFANWLYEAVERIEIEENENYLYDEYGQEPRAYVNIFFKNEFYRKMFECRQNEKKFETISFSEAIHKLVEEKCRHDDLPLSEEEKEIVEIYRALDKPKQRQLLGKAYELQEKQNEEKSGDTAKIAPPDLDLATARVVSNVKK